MTYHLHYLANEDEAEMTGYDFTPQEDGTVLVARTYHFPEYEDYDPPQIMSKPEARALWKSCMDSNEYERIC